MIARISGGVYNLLFYDLDLIQESIDAFRTAMVEEGDKVLAEKMEPVRRIGYYSIANFLNFPILCCKDPKASGINQRRSL